MTYRLASESINVKDFGAMGDDVTDDTAAINAAFAYARTRMQTIISGSIVDGTGMVGGSGGIFAQNVRVYFPDGVYKTTGPINATTFLGGGLVIEGWGATIDCQFTGGCGLDMLGSRWMCIKGLTIYGNSGFGPNYGLQIGRTVNGAAADDHVFLYLRIIGTFAKACLYDFASEDVLFVGLYLYNQSTAAGTYALILDASNFWNITSTFVTQSIAQNTQQSMTQTRFEMAKIINLSSTVGPVWLNSGVTQCDFATSYASATGGAAYCVTLNVGTLGGSNPILQLGFDLHCETIPFLTSIFLITGGSGKTIHGIDFKDDITQLESGSIFKLDTGVTNLTINNLKMETYGFWSGTPVIFDQPAQYTLINADIALPDISYWNAPASFSGKLQSGPGLDPPFRVATKQVRIFTGAGTITMTAGDEIVVVNKASGAATAVTLVASPSTGVVYTIKDTKGDANTNNITISPATGSIDGASTLVINTAYGVARLVYNGFEWNAI